MKDYENYIVYEDGRIFSKRFKKFITPKKNWDGYERIQIWKNNSCKFIGIHRVVAETFIPNPDNKPFVNHKNGIKNDNRVENLEWCTQKENIKHSFENGMSTPTPKNWKLLSKSVEQYDLNNNYIQTFPSLMEVERTLGIPHASISYACKHGGRAKQWKWKYAKTSND